MNKFEYQFESVPILRDQLVVENWDETLDTGKLRTAILEARRRIHAAIRVDEIELLSEPFSAVGGKLNRRVLLTDSDSDEDNLALCARECEWLGRKGYPSYPVRFDLEPSFVLVDDELFISMFPIRMIHLKDREIIHQFQTVFDQIVEAPILQVPPYDPSDDEYFDEYAWFPVPLTSHERYEQRLKCHGNDPAQLLLRLHDSVRRRASDQVCLQWWGRFIRARDQGRCVACGSTDGLAAHHITRKVLFSEARFMTGNGITLCKGCHAQAHEGFNGRPNLQQPMDAQGGEKIEMLAWLFRVLAETSEGHPDDDYFLSAQVLSKFKLFQGLKWDYCVAGTPIQQAAQIWRGCSVNTATALITSILQTTLDDTVQNVERRLNRSLPSEDTGEQHRR